VDQQSGAQRLLPPGFGEAAVLGLGQRLRLLQLNPRPVLAAVGQRGSQLPDASGHAGGSRVQVEMPLTIGETELVAR